MVDMRMKKYFFDTKRVLRAVDKGRRAALSKAGAFIRTTARRSIRKRKRAAPPGKPPSSHTGLLKRFIFFGYDAGSDSVVIGPARLAKSTEAPHTLEFGGTVKVRRDRLMRVEDTGRDKRGRFTKGKYKRVKAGTRLTYQARPFMGPAIDKERSKLPKFWRDSVRGS